MLTLVTGGSASGKSEFAERLLLKCDVHNRIYLATMESNDSECDVRIRRHRQARAGRGFQTIEQSTGLSNIILPKSSAILLECLSNLVANELYCPLGAHEHAFEEILFGIDNICGQAKDVIIVSGEVFTDGKSYDAQTLHYIELMGRLNQAIAQHADQVIEVVYSIPVYYKGVKL